MGLAVIYLSVPPRGEAWGPYREAGLGIMMTPKSGMRLERTLSFGGPWAADNGCYAQGDAFDLDGFLSWLERMSPARDTCLFAVAPDVVGDATATLARSEPVLPVIREMGYPAALVAQDGLEALTIPWESFDALFIGGSTEWKLSEPAYRVVADAKARDKWVHVGRVNGFSRLAQFAAMGADSADGTTMAFGPDRKLPLVVSWLEQLQRQARLPMMEATP